MDIKMDNYIHSAPFCANLEPSCSLQQCGSILGEVESNQTCCCWIHGIRSLISEINITILQTIEVDVLNRHIHSGCIFNKDILNQHLTLTR